MSFKSFTGSPPAKFVKFSDYIYRIYFVKELFFIKGLTGVFLSDKRQGSQTVRRPAVKQKPTSPACLPAGRQGFRRAGSKVARRPSRYAKEG